ncbi:MAG: sulfur carrier protein ThiS, partial [Candidatus Saganbacteria bacterium]|nr:sulfur carrier protein ThiS [Candidatus Saganbacteria bacterium]
GIKKEAVAIELNDQIIKKSDYDSVVLKDGDRVEIVSYMGGG